MTATKTVNGAKVAALAIVNAFIGKPDPPDDQELALVLGSAKALWDKLVDRLRKFDVDVKEWGSYSPKAGWSLRLKRKERIIVYLIPVLGSFQVSLVLGDKAVKAARASALPESVLKTIAGARRYAEGTGIRLTIKTAGDLAVVEKLAFIKIDN